MRIVLATAIALFAAGGAFAGPGDDVEDLGSDLLGGDLLEQLGIGDGADPNAQVPDIDQLRQEMNRLQQELANPPIGGEAAPPQGAPPLQVVRDKMQTAQTLIEKRVTTGKTEQVQGEIVSELDKLIEKLEQQCKNCKNGQCNKPGSKQQQTAKSTPKPGPPKPGDQQSQQQANSNAPPTPNQSQQAAQQSQAVPQGGVASAAEEAVDPQQMVKELWGQLPDRMRQQMMQSSFDDFLPEYRDDIEAYFRRLADPQR